MTKKPETALKLKRQQLGQKHARRMELFFIQENARLIDTYFIEKFNESIAGLTFSEQGISYAIVALGGYGRSEQCVFSDVDVMLLFDENIHENTEELIREIIYPLWDIGLDVGHATRTVDECLELIDTDLEILTSLLDARFVCGDVRIFNRLETSLKIAVQGAQTRYVNQIKERCFERHNNFGDSSDLLEPNLKNGLGGLRDYHSMLWLGKIRFAIDGPDDLETMGFFSANEYDAYKDALAFIWFVRNHLHILSKRKCDQLYFEFQEAIAQALKFKKRRGQKPVERFIGVLHEKMELVKQHHLQFLSELGREKTFFINKNMFKRSRIQGLMVSKSMLNFTSEEAVIQSPELMMKIFLESARLKMPLCSSARRTIAEYGYLVDNFRYSGKIRQMFERLMYSVGDDFNILYDLLNTGFLVQYIPEFDKIVNRIQYNQYHIYPVDRHSIHVLQAVRAFSSPNGMEKNPLHANLYAEITNKKILHWAALFHDIGKGAIGSEHSISGAKIARKILSKRGLYEKNIRAVSFLIENHLFLINIAKRRDIDDEETAVLCARRIKDADRLKMLYLLTVSDSISTGPNAWNSWTASLLRALFFKVLEILESGEIVSKRKEKSLEIKRKRILEDNAGGCYSEKELERLLDRMSPRYLVNNSEKKIVQHLKLYKKIGDAGFAMKVRKKKKSSSRTAIICGRETGGYFSKIAGVFTLNDYNILDAQIYSWGNRTALDVFTIQPFYTDVGEDKKLKNVEKDFRKVLDGDIDLESALKGKIENRSLKKKVKLSGKHDKVKIDNSSSSFFTIVEVFTYDFPGLLFAVTNSLFQHQIDIVYAKIGTHVDQVVDTFYVRSLNGGKIFSEEILLEIETAILSAISFFEPAEDDIDG